MQALSTLTRLAAEAVYQEANLVSNDVRNVWSECFEQMLAASLKPAEVTGSGTWLKNCLLTCIDAAGKENPDLYTECSAYLKTPAPLTYFLENPPISETAKASLMEWYVKMGGRRGDLDLYVIRKHSQVTYGIVDHFLVCYNLNRVELTYREKVQWISTRDDYCPIWWVSWVSKKSTDNVAIDACKARNYFEEQFMDWVIMKNFDNFKPMEFLIQSDMTAIKQQRTIVPLHYWFRGTNVFVNYNGWMVGHPNQDLMTSKGYRLSTDLILCPGNFKVFTPLMFLQCAFMIQVPTTSTEDRYELHKFIISDHHDHSFNPANVNPGFEAVAPRVMEDGVTVYQYIIPEHMLDGLSDDMYLVSV